MEFVEAGIQFDKRHLFKPDWQSYRIVMEIDLSQINNYAEVGDIWIENWLSEVNKISLNQHTESFEDHNPDSINIRHNRLLHKRDYVWRKPRERRVPLTKNKSDLRKNRKAYISKLELWQQLFQKGVIRFKDDYYYYQEPSRDILGTSYRKLENLYQKNMEKYVFSREVSYDDNDVVTIKGTFLNSIATLSN